MVVCRSDPNYGKSIPKIEHCPETFRQIPLACKENSHLRW